MTQRTHIYTIVFAALIIICGFSVSVFFITSSVTAQQAPVPPNLPGTSGDGDGTDSPLSGNACVTDQFFGAVFFDNTNFTDPVASHFRFNISEPYTPGTWGANPPELGVENDQSWSVKYKADFFIGEMLPGYIPNQVVQTVYPNFAGTATIRIDGVTVYGPINHSTPSEGVGTPIALFSGGGTTAHKVEVDYSNPGQSNASLQLKVIACDTLPQNQGGAGCTAKELFFKNAGTGPSIPDRMYFTDKVSDVTIPSGGSGTFSMNYGVQGSPVTVQWQRRSPANTSWSNIGTNQTTYTEGPPADPYDRYYYRTKLSNGLCQFVENLHTGRLFIGPPQPTPTPTPSPSPSPDPGQVQITCPETVRVDEVAFFTATGGVGNFTWDAPDGNPNACTQNCTENFSTTFDRPGWDSVEVRRGTSQDSCVVQIVDTLSLTCPTMAPAESVVLAESRGGPLNEPYWWYAPDGTPSQCNPTQETCYPYFETVFDTSSIGRLVSIDVVRGAVTDTCIIEVTEPESELVCETCTGRNCTGTNEITILDGGTVFFRAHNFDPDVSIDWLAPCAQPQDRLSGIGENAFSGVYETSNGCSNVSSNEVYITNGLKSAICYVDISVPTPTPTETPQCDNRFGEDGNNSCEQQVGMYIYDRSPIDAQDCSYPGINIIGTQEFPSGECDPHDVMPNEAPPIDGQTRGLLYQFDENNKLIVVAENTGDQVSIDAVNGLSAYSSLFEGNQQISSKITGVGQINTYYTIMVAISDFNRFLKSVSNNDDPFSRIMGDMTAYISSTYIEGATASYNGGSNVLRFVNTSALDGETIVHELSHALLNRVGSSNFMISLVLPRKAHEFNALNEGIADYYATRYSDNTYVGDYSLGKRGILPRTVSSVPEKFWPYVFWSTDVLEEDEHILGQSISYTLSQLRTHIIRNAGADTQRQLDLLDGFIPSAFHVSQNEMSAILGKAPVGVSIKPLTNYSMFQTFYGYLGKFLDANGFLYTDFLINDLVYGAQGIGVGIGDQNQVSISDLIINPGTAICESNSVGDMYPEYKLTLPPMRAINEYLKTVTIEVLNTADQVVFQKEYNIENESRARGLNAPITGFVDLNFLVEAAPQAVYLRATVTTTEGHSTTTAKTTDTFPILACTN